MSAVDRKFVIQAVNPVNGKRYTEADALLLCAKDAAVPAALIAYREECKRIGANPEHIDSIQKLLDRVICFQAENGARTPDTVGAEIPRCLDGEGVGMEERDEEALYTLMEETANMLRGMTLDPSIPSHAKDAMRSKIQALESKVDDYNAR